MTTKAQDAIIDGMADDGTVFVEPLEIKGRKFSTVRVCVLAESGKRVSSWSLIADDGAILTLEEGQSVIGAWEWERLSEPTRETT